MTEFDFNQLVTRHAMGQAYLRITQEMGPSPQLIAFVNYDKVTEDFVGLESFNIMDQHEQILQDIQGDNSLDIACESLGGRIKSTLERIKNTVTFNRHDNLTDLLHGHLEPRKSNIYVPTRNHINMSLGYAKAALDVLDWILPKIPDGKSVDAWEQFYKEHSTKGQSGDLGTRIRETRRSTLLYSQMGRTVDFDKAGWDVSSFQSSLQSLVDLQEEFESKFALVEDKCLDLNEVLHLVQSSNSTQEIDAARRRHEILSTAVNISRDKNHPNKRPVVVDVATTAVNEIGRQQRKENHDLLMKMIPQHVTTAMNDVAVCVDEATDLIEDIELWIYKSLVDVSRHFELM